MTTLRPSDFLRVRLPPPRFTIPAMPSSSPNKTTESWTKITDKQVGFAVENEHSFPKRWSIEPALADDLIKTVSSDLDCLLLQHPNLSIGLREVITTLESLWNEEFGDQSTFHDSHTLGKENTTTVATRLLLKAVSRAFDHIKAIRQPAEPEVESLCAAVVEDKRARGFTAVLAELYERVGKGIFNSNIASALSPSFVQDQYWILVNKGIFYVAAYHVNWIIFAGLTGFCVGHRRDKHMFWSSPVYNHRDGGDKLTAQTLNQRRAISVLFGDAPLPEHPQRDFFLLFLAVTLRGAHDTGSAWVRILFSGLCALNFTAPDASPPLDTQFTSTGADINSTSELTEEHDAISDHDSDDTYTPSSSGSGSERSLASTTLLSGRHQLPGRWYGDLREPAYYTVKLLHLLASGNENSIYAGKLFQKGKSVAAVAIKASEDRDALMTEFRRYQALQRLMGDGIPRCYGLCVRWNTSYLVTSLVPNDPPARELSKAERGAIYEVLRKMHRAGWAHNDIVDDASRSLRNLVWNSDGHPVLIDLETATRHTCKDGCRELSIQSSPCLRLWDCFFVGCELVRQRKFFDADRHTKSSLFGPAGRKMVESAPPQIMVPSVTEGVVFSGLGGKPLGLGRPLWTRWSSSRLNGDYGAFGDRGRHILKARRETAGTWPSIVDSVVLIEAQWRLWGLR
ncbi:hypothetical protein K438DRAFT_1751325 [Mycena galopus ATCC 62051]|nr:hypothetical protein K438DRAFT_1751325 [Mycena galopus ATCC 62051]